MSNPFQENELKKFQEIIFKVKTCNNYNQWSKDDIQSWSLKIESQNLQKLNNEILVEILCVLDRAVELDKKYKIREIQMVSLLFLLCKNQNQGRILQILTGQGKTLTISCLAVLLCLLGNQVDIVTSNDVLAKRDSQELKSFYSLFNLNCSHNIQIENQVNKEQIQEEKEEEEQEEIKQDEQNARKDQKRSKFEQKEDKEDNFETKYRQPEEKEGTLDCYQDNVKIVYGTAHSFQADILKHEFYKRGIRGQRKFNMIIVDEVDSMLVDSRITELYLHLNNQGLARS
ncbi:hypothetical protein ABPG74_020821 [Tetrahymena malaccensis]